MNQIYLDTNVLESKVWESNVIGIKCLSTKLLESPVHASDMNQISGYKCLGIKGFGITCNPPLLNDICTLVAQGAAKLLERKVRGPKKFS